MDGRTSAHVRSPRMENYAVTECVKCNAFTNSHIRDYARREAFWGRGMVGDTLPRSREHFWGCGGSAVSRIAESPLFVAISVKSGDSAISVISPIFLGDFGGKRRFRRIKSPKSPKSPLFWRFRWKVSISAIYVTEIAESQNRRFFLGDFGGKWRFR